MWQRIKKVTLFASISSLPAILWFIWVYIVTNHRVGGRNLGMEWGILTAKFQLFRITGILLCFRVSLSSQ